MSLMGSSRGSVGNEGGAEDGSDDDEIAIKVWFLDNSFTTIGVHRLTTVGEVVQNVCRRKVRPPPDLLGHFALFASEEGNELEPYPLNNDSSALTAQEQNTKLVLQAWLISPYLLRSQDKGVTRMLFMQARQAILSGQLHCGKGDATQLAAIALHITFGPFDGDRHGPGFILHRLFE